jgi:hypothetical protein
MRAGRQGELTNWKPQRGGQVRILEEDKQVRDTHSLRNTEGGGSELENKSD